MLKSFTNSVLRGLGRRSQRLRDWRRDPRFRMDVDGDLGGVACTVEDLSLGGARVAVPAGLAPAVGEVVSLSFTVKGLGHRLDARVRRVTQAATLMQVGLEFTDGQDDAIDLLGDSLDDLRAAAAG